MKPATEVLDLAPVSTGLVWGLKRSLLGYLRRIPDGLVSIDDGVQLTSTYSFLFPLLDSASFTPATGSGILRFGGFVHLHGHLGTMYVTLASPWLHLNGDTGWLSFDTSPNDTSDRRDSLFDISHVPHPTSVGGTLRWDAMEPNLTAVGAELFQANYPIGTAFDPIGVRIPAHSSMLWRE